MRRKIQGNTSCQSFYNPFAILDQYFPRLPGNAPRRPDRERPILRGRSPEGEEDLFWQAMAEVRPLRPGLPERIPPPPPTRVPPRFLEREDREVLQFLGAMVRGEGSFELSFTEEYVDGAVVGLSPDILNKLRCGAFSYQGYLDLHGCNREQARSLATEFVLESVSRNRRCVLIISGRGLNSQDREPVLKRHLVKWLTHAPLKRLVLAFASARTWDGGAGAFYVLLRGKEVKSRFVVPA